MRLAVCFSLLLIEFSIAFYFLTQVDQSTAKAALTIWFIPSLLIVLLGNFILRAWLIKHGLRLKFGMTGMPNYLLEMYEKWCKDNGRSASAVVWLMTAATINLVNSAFLMLYFR